MVAERFVRVFLAVLVAALAAIAGGNLALDPYRAYRLVDIEALRPYRDKGVSRIAKAEILEHERCEVAIVGTSRAQIALDPAHPAWGAPACNLALTGMGAGELGFVLARLRRQPETRRWVIALDFASFGRGNAPHDDFARSRFDPELSAFDYHAGLLLGGATTDASWQMLRDWWKRRPPTERSASPIPGCAARWATASASSGRCSACWSRSEGRSPSRTTRRPCPRSSPRSAPRARRASR
jgi:hypothetical protein